MEDTIKLAFNIGQLLAKSKELLQKSTAKPPSTIKDILKTPIQNLTKKQKLLGGGLGAGAGLAAAYGATELLENAGLRDLIGKHLYKDLTPKSLDIGSDAFKALRDKSQDYMNRVSIQNLQEGITSLEAKKAPLMEASNKLDIPKSLDKFFREATEKYRPGAEEMGYLRTKAQLHKAAKGFGGIASLIPGPGSAAAASSDLANLAGQMDAANSIAMGKYLGIEEGYLKTLRDRVRNQLEDSSKFPITDLRTNISRQLSGLGGESLARKEVLTDATANLLNPQKVKDIFKQYRDTISSSPSFPSNPASNFGSLAKENIGLVSKALEDIKTRSPKALQSFAEQIGITGKPLELARSLADESDMFSYTGLPTNVKSTIVEQIQERGSEQLTDSALQEIVSSAIKKGMGNEAGEALLKRLFREGSKEAVKKTSKDLVSKLLGVVLDTKDAVDTGKLLDYLDGKTLKEFLKADEMLGLKGNFQIDTPLAVDRAIKDYGLAYNQDSLKNLAEIIQKSKTSYGKALAQAARANNQDRIQQLVDMNPRFMF